MNTFIRSCTYIYWHDYVWIYVMNRKIQLHYNTHLAEAGCKLADKIRETSHQAWRWLLLNECTCHNIYFGGACGVVSGYLGVPRACGSRAHCLALDAATAVCSITMFTCYNDHITPLSFFQPDLLFPLSLIVPLFLDISLFPSNLPVYWWSIFSHLLIIYLLIVSKSTHLPHSTHFAITTSDPPPLSLRLSIISIYICHTVLLHNTPFYAELYIGAEVMIS